MIIKMMYKLVKLNIRALYKTKNKRACSFACVFILDSINFH